MYYVYVLKSQKHRRLYYGFSSDLMNRIKEHNSGYVPSTKSSIPWKLIYYEAYLSEDDAKTREKQLKNYESAFGFLRKRIKNSISQN
jgi:putative endonuclease